MEQRHDSRIEHFRELGKEVEYLGLKDRDLLDQKGQLDDQIRTDHKRLKNVAVSPMKHVDQGRFLKN